MASSSSQISDTVNTTPTQTNNNLVNFGGGVTSSSTTYSTTTGNDVQQDVKSLKKTLNLEEIEKLPYEIHRYSSFSTNYVPE